MEIKTKIEYGNLKKLIKAMAKKYSAKVGLLANKGGSEPVSENMDLAGLGLAMEYGADIDHPGGTPYFINEWGMATFVKKDSFYGQLLIKRGQVTKPHRISIPARSWLSFPVSRNNGRDMMSKIPEKAKTKYGISKTEIVDYIIETGDTYPLAVITAEAALEQIQEAFETQGFGEWLPNAPQTIAKKHSADPLVDTGRLKQKVTFEVTERK